MDATEGLPAGPTPSLCGDSLQRPQARPESIDKGLNELVQHHVVELVKGHGEKNVDSALSLGTLALWKGLEMSGDKSRAFIETVVADHTAAGEAVQTAFVRAAEAAGVRCG